MDAKDKDESANRQREAALARRLGEALDQLNPQSAKVCPDAEVIAAYAERALGVDELAQCEDHFATCGRCRNILKVLAAASDAPLAENEVAQLGQRVSAVRPPVEISTGAAKRPRSKVATWSTRWLAPALGIAAVLTVWFVMRPPWRAMDRSGSPTLIAKAPREELPENAPSVLEQPQKTAPAPDVPSAKIGAPNSNAESSTHENLKPQNEIREGSPNASLAENLPREKKESAAAAEENKTKSLAMPQPAASPQPMIASRMKPAAPLPEYRAQADSSAPAAREAPRATGPPDAISQAAPVVQGTNKPAAAPMSQLPATDVPLNGRNWESIMALAPGLPATIVLKSASGETLWRIGLAGAIERSTEEGKKWGKQKSPSKENWLSGAAVSDSVCWIAGSNGAIARTTDGERWKRISPPAQAEVHNGKLPDWTGIAASDARTATITGSDGTRFATTDGGKTWQRQ